MEYINGNTTGDVDSYLETRESNQYGQAFPPLGSWHFTDSTHADKIITYSSHSFAGNINHISRKAADLVYIVASATPDKMES
jgi:hypothetical protein